VLYKFILIAILIVLYYTIIAIIIIINLKKTEPNLTEQTVHHILAECRQYTEALNQLNISTILDAALCPNADSSLQILSFLRKYKLYELI